MSFGNLMHLSAATAMLLVGGAALHLPPTERGLFPPVCGSEPATRGLVLADARFRFSSDHPSAQAWRGASGFAAVPADSIRMIEEESTCAHVRQALTSIRRGLSPSYTAPPPSAEQLYVVRLPGHWYVFDEAVEPGVTLILNDALSLVVRRFK